MEVLDPLWVLADVCHEAVQVRGPGAFLLGARGVETLHHGQSSGRVPAAQQPVQHPLLVAHAAVLVRGREASPWQGASHLETILLVHGLPDVGAVVPSVPLGVLDEIYILQLPALGAVAGGHVHPVTWQVLLELALRFAQVVAGAGGDLLSRGHGHIEFRIAAASVDGWLLGVDAARHIGGFRGTGTERERSRSAEAQTTAAAGGTARVLVLLLR
mmetsp:Transcript_14183/g.40299  ORF Transcript_14183/g.40299 Transcript_14183/m.40299 type:complete len:215 (-) Transcript_14183:235-879(-)